jgi:hypothetical protein
MRLLNHSSLAVNPPAVEVSRESRGYRNHKWTTLACCQRQRHLALSGSTDNTSFNITVTTYGLPPRFSTWEDIALSLVSLSGGAILLPSDDVARWIVEIASRSAPPKRHLQPSRSSRQHQQMCL